MQDLETESLWSQVSGECISGPMLGKKLTQFPARHATYKDFKKDYAQGQLLKKPEKGEAGSHYNSYFTDKEKLGIFGRSNSFTRLDGKDKVIGIRLDSREVAVSYAYLDKNKFALIADPETPIVLLYNADGASISAFVFKKNDTDYLASLKIKDGIILIDNGKIKYDAVTGEAITEGIDNIKIKPTMTAFWFAWASFFPETELIK